MKSETVFSLLRGEFGNVLIDNKIIKIAKKLENEGILKCLKIEDGIKIAVNSQVKQAAIQKLKKMDFVIFDYENSLEIHIQNPYRRVREMDGNVMVPFTPFKLEFADILISKIERSEKQSLNFADLYCDQITAADVWEKLKQETDYTLIKRKDGFFLNETRLSEVGTIRHAFLNVLFDHRMGRLTKSYDTFLTFNDIAVFAPDTKREQKTYQRKMMSRVLQEIRTIVSNCLLGKTDLIIETLNLKSSLLIRLPFYIAIRESY